MIVKTYARAVMLSVAMIVLGATAKAQQPGRGYLMTQHVREEVRAATAVGTLPPDQVLHFDMMLPVSAPQELDQFLADTYNPASVNYRHFLTPAQFTARFGPSQANWNELVSFAKQNGFTLLSGSRDEMDLRLAAPVRAIEAAFHVKLRVFNHPTEARTFYSPDTEPSIDMQAAVWHITGLDNFATPHARVHARSAVVAKPLTASGACPGNSYCGSDMRFAYYGTGPLTGAGQSIGLVEFYGYDAADLNTYYGNAGQANAVPVKGISVDGTAVACLYSKGCDDTEQTLDITQALGMAPGLAQLNVYVGSSDTAILSAMSVVPAGSVTGKLDAQLSCSWGWGPADPAADDPYFKKFAAQGQSFFTAAGDSAAYTANSQYVYPADDANVTVVGGTDLATAGAGGSWLYESAWSSGGGGYLAADGIAIPAWQTAAIAQFNAQSGKVGSTSFRNSPDVAAEANFDFYVCADQQGCSANRYGGTSFAAPMWAGYMALVNQQALLNGRAPVGFLNAVLYTLGTGSAYAQAFHDVTTGSNGYPAVSGYDLATGWGSPNGPGLIAALAGSATPGFTLSTSGSVSVPEGGSGTVTLTSTVTGGFNSSIALSASGQPSGVTVSFSPSSVAGAGSSTVTFKIAAAVAAGNYPITLTGTAASSSAGAPKTPSSTLVTLTVTVPNFTLSTTGSIAVAAGTAGSVAISGAASGGFDSAIMLSASGLPSGVVATFSPSSITGSGASTVTFQAAATAAAGVYPITVTGTSSSLVQRTTVTLTVNVPSFSLTASTASMSVVQGASATLTLSSHAIGGFAAPIVLTAAGEPSGVSVSFSPASIVGAGSSTITIGVAASTPAGAYPMVLTGISGGLKQTVPVTLNVGAASFTMAASAGSLSTLQGASGSIALTTTVTGVLSAPVTLSVDGQPTGVIATLTAGSVTPPGSVTLNVVVSASTAAGSYPMTIHGISGKATGSATLTLVVGGVTRPTFIFGVGTTAVTVVHGTSTAMTVQTALTSSTAPSIAFSVSGLPSGVTASFNPSSINGAGVSTVTLAAAPTAKPGTATLTFSGTAGTNVQSSSVTLTVN